MSFIPGANVGPYRIVEQAERNGVATAYTAYQPSLGRYVSIVVAPTIDRDDVALQRQYQRQIELVLSLRHPNILTVLDHGEHLGVSFIVTELLEAEPLSERLGAPWPLVEVVRVLRPIAAALDFAHGYGVVHGEMRPSLVVLTPDGTPILSGFGQSTRRYSEAEGLPVTPEPGRRTPSVSLEIARAQAADRRGLALIAYEMLTGRTVDVDAGDFEQPLAPAQLGSPLLTPPVERALLRELSGETQDRHPDATTFMEDLAAPINAPSATTTRISTPPPPMAALPPRGESRRRLLTVAAIFTALAVLGSLALLLRGGEPSRPIGPSRTPGPDASPVAATSESPSTSSGSPVTGSSVGSPAAETAPARAVSPGAPSAGANTSADVTPTRPPALQVVVSTPGSVQAQTPTPLQPGGPRPGGASGPATGTGGPPATSASPGAPKPAGGPVITPIVFPTSSAAQKPSSAAPAATRVPATWRVIGDPSGRWTFDDQGRIAARTDDGASLLLFPEIVEDITYSAQVNTESCQATLVFRAQDDENLLMAIYIPDGIPGPNAAGGGIWLYQRVEGVDVPIRAVRPSTMKRTGEPARLQVVTSGPQISVSLDDEPAIQAVDTAPRPGKLGLMIYSAGGRQCEATFADIRR